MSLFDALILSILQGVTEFLPISSSGHLVLLQFALDLDEVPLFFDLVLHLGTTFAVIIFYFDIIKNILKDLYLYIISGKEKRKEVLSRGNIKIIVYILISTIITALAGFSLKPQLTIFFFKPKMVIYFLIITGFILLSTIFAPAGKKKIQQVGIFLPLVVGGAQSFAMLPGISRSGTTITAGLFSGLERKEAGKYSFLLSIPSLLGACFFEYIFSESNVFINTGQFIYLFAFFISFISGFLTIKFLIKTLVKGKLYFFSFYCFIIVGLGIMIL